MWMYWKPCFWKNVCVANERQLRMRLTDAMVLVRDRRCDTDRRYSNVIFFFAMGYALASHL